MTNNYNNDAYYGTPPQFPMASSRSQPNDSQPAFNRTAAEMMTFASSDPLRLGDYGFSQSHGTDMLSTMPPGALDPHAGQLHHSSSNIPVSTANLMERLSSAFFPCDPLSGIGSSMSMPLDAASAFAYDPSGYPQANPLFESTFNRQAMAQRPSFHSQALGLEPSASYSNSQTQVSTRNSYWTSSPAAKETNTTIQAAPMTQRSNSNNSKSTDSSYTQPLPHRRRPNPQSSTQVSSHGSSHRYIQPKRPSPTKNSSGKSATSGEITPYTSIYSNSGIDMMSILAEVVSRPDPKINIGAVDLSCAFVLCDIYQEDHPIVYVSDAFVRLTGYMEEEIVGHNCRFLQDPDGKVQKGVPRKFVDQQTAFRFRSTIEDRNEIQATLINYRKGGQPFMNLITMIPVRWNSPDYRYYVGFQVDLVEKPDAITRKNPNGTYMINYQRNQLPNYVVPPPDIYRMHPDLVTYFNSDVVSNFLDRLGSDPDCQQYLDRVLVENIDDVIHVLSPDGEFQYLSPSCRKVLEYESYELVNKTLSTICHPSDIGGVIRELRSSTNSDPISVMYRIRTKYSGYVWFESHGSWYIGDRGRQHMVMTGRVRPVYHLDQIAKIAEGGLAENDLWAKLSISGIILFISSKARPVLGRVPEDLVGKSIQDLIGPDSRQEAQQALEMVRTGQHISFNHKIRHKKGHMLQAQTVLYPGDTKEGIPPSFVVAQLRFPKSAPAEDVSSTDLAATAAAAVVSTGDTSIGASKDGGTAANQPTVYDMLTLFSSNALPSGNQYVPEVAEPLLFTELSTTRGSSWEVELRELVNQNRILSDEVQRLLARRKKRKRKQSAVPVEKSCAMCQTRTTPEWRRGPSGNRDLCNSCGLRWAKQVRNAAQTAA